MDVLSGTEVGDSLLIEVATSSRGSLGYHPSLSFPARGVESLSVKDDIVPSANGAANATRLSRPRLKPPLEICHCVDSDKA
jgi:hypothetical protein